MLSTGWKVKTKDHWHIITYFLNVHFFRVMIFFLPKYFEKTRIACSTDSSPKEVDEATLWQKNLAY
jgi:hypothetical protein